MLLARRSSLVLAIVMGVLVVAAVAYAATQLIQTGSPVKSEESFVPTAGAGVAIPKTEGLLGIAAPDPGGGPPWTMRVYDTSRGLGCVQVGRLVDGRIGVLGEDGAFNDDGRFHPLPSQASQAEGECVLLDRDGNAFLAVGNYGVAASGLPHQCYLERHPSLCAKADPRDVFYGLLGPDAREIEYTLDGQTHLERTVGPEGAYLIIERTPAKVIALGAGAGDAGAVPSGGGTLSGRTGTIKLPSPIKRVIYTDGRICTILQAGFRDNRGGDCLPPVGYVPQRIEVPSQREMASPVSVRMVSVQPARGRRQATQAGLSITFIAHASVTSALSGYSVTLQAPSTGRCRVGVSQANADLARNVRSGEQVQVTLTSGYGNRVTLFPGCPGLARGRVLYTEPSIEASFLVSYLPIARQRVVTVGRFTYNAP
jgi:hypothetical protein